MGILVNFSVHSKKYGYPLKNSDHKTPFCDRALKTLKIVTLNRFYFFSFKNVYNSNVEMKILFNTNGLKKTEIVQKYPFCYTACVLVKILAVLNQTLLKMINLDYHRCSRRT